MKLNFVFSFFNRQRLGGHLVILSAFFLFGCASYQREVEVSRDYMQSGKFDEALEILKKKMEEAKGDKLAFMLEYATVLHQAKRYDESNKYFAQAEKIAEVNDYTSVTNEVASTLGSEGLNQFKLESFEFLLINIYEALNYIMLNDYENAQVMARKINEKIVKLEVDGDSRRRQTGFANYLAGIMWESQGDWDNAYVLYNKANELLEGVPILQTDLLRAAKVSQREMDYAKWKKQWPDIEKKIAGEKPKQNGEFVFIYQQGWIPRKQARPDNKKFPMMVPSYSPLTLRGLVVKAESHTQTTEKVLNLEKIAVQTLEEDYKRLIAKKIIGTVGRAVIADQVNRRAQGLGTLAFIALDAIDQADLRQWSTLPSSFQLVRLPLAPGKHTITITPENGDTPIWTGDVEIKKGKKVFHTLRTF